MGDSVNGNSAQASFADAMAKARAIAAKAMEAANKSGEDNDNRKRTLSNDNPRANMDVRASENDYERDSKRPFSHDNKSNKYGLGTAEQQSRQSYINSSYGSGLSREENTKQEFEIPINTLKAILRFRTEYYKHVHDISGSDLKVEREKYDERDKYGKVVVYGTKEQIRKGKEMIDRLVVSSQSPDFEMKKFIDQNTPTSSILQTLGVPSNIRREQLAVPNNKVGLVIGRGGETIRELMEFSGARMNVVMEQTLEQAERNEKMINIQGTEESIKKAKEFISQIMAGEYVSPRGGNNQNLNGFEKASIQVPTDKVGLVIGRGGETIKGLMQQTKTKIFIEMPEINPPPPTRTINISGTHDNIEYAKNLIYEKINVGPPGYSNRYIPPNAYTTPGYGQGYGGYSYGGDPSYQGYNYQGAETAYQYPTGYEGGEYQQPQMEHAGDGYAAEAGQVPAPEGDPNQASYPLPDPNDPAAVAAYEAYCQQYNEYYQNYYASMGYTYNPEDGTYTYNENQEGQQAGYDYQPPVNNQQVDPATKEDETNQEPNTETETNNGITKEENKKEEQKDEQKEE